MTPQSFFVTGTDTGVGKTLVTCALLHRAGAAGLRAVGMKPVAAGRENGVWEDVEKIVAAGNVTVPREWVNPYPLLPAVAPHIGARQAGIVIDLGRLTRAYSELCRLADCILVEGVGGFRVPLSGDRDSADLAQSLGLPVILVVGMRLGCLNHALLTAEAVRARGLVLAGWVANCIDPGMAELEANVATLRERLGCRLLGALPYSDQVDPMAISTRLNLPQTV